MLLDRKKKEYRGAVVAIILPIHGESVRKWLIANFTLGEKNTASSLGLFFSKFCTLCILNSRSKKIVGNDFKVLECVVEFFSGLGIETLRQISSPQKKSKSLPAKKKICLAVKMEIFSVVATFWPPQKRKKILDLQKSFFLCPAEASKN